MSASTTARQDAVSVSSPPLPTPRTLLTTLLSSIPPPRKGALPPSAPANPNPLLHAPQSIRTLLTTLHILLPSLLLPALDLLDRSLVTRIALAQPSAPVPHPPGLPSESASPCISAAVPHSSAATESIHNGSGRTKTKNQIYLVRSSQATRARLHVPEQVYVVRLGAWNCNCAAFAFSAFPGAASSLAFDGGAWDEGIDEDEGWGEGERWEFGGLSRDGVGGGGVPCCKHILACVLAERLGEWVGGAVKEREVGKEEMAGLTCDG